LFHRGYQCAAYDLQAKVNFDVSSATRPSCWISMIPAGGLLLMPEGSHGCDCSQNIQTSLALAHDRSDTVPPKLSEVRPLSPEQLLVIFDEPVEATSAGNIANYAIRGTDVRSAMRMPNHLERVQLAVTRIPDGEPTLTVTKVQDLRGNAMTSTDIRFAGAGTRSARVSRPRRNGRPQVSP
jgi:hypothetical protein